MSSITQTTNMTLKVTAFFMDFMESSKNIIDDDAYDAITSLWNKKANQENLFSNFPGSTTAARKSTTVRANSSGKKVKDPNKPKRGNSAYIFFCKEMRKEVNESMTDSTPRTVTAELGKRWNTAKLDSVEKWEKMAADDKARYENEMVNYTQPSEEEWSVLIENKEKKSKKKRGGPKGACSAYIFFCKEMRSQIKLEQPDIKSKEIMSELGKRWNTAKLDSVEKWEKMAADDKARYKEEVTSESESESESEVKKKELVDELVEEVPKKTSSKKKRVLAMKYWKEQVGDEIAEECGLEGVELTKELSKRWKSLSKEDKVQWKKEAEEA